MSGKGRGRGEAPKFESLPERQARRPSPHETSSSSSSGGGNGDNGGERTIRGRGGFKSRELNTIPEGIFNFKGKAGPGEKPFDCYANFVKINPMSGREFHQYRVEFKPNVESVLLRKRLFNTATEGHFERKVVFDGMHDARSSTLLAQETTTVHANHPEDAAKVFTITIKNVGKITGGFELIRIYNMHMKTFLRMLGFFRVSTTGAYIHSSLSTPIGNNDAIMTVRGFRTAANVHQDNQILMNLESVHKLMQKKNVLEYMREHTRNPNFKEVIRTVLTGKLVVANYNQIVYRIEDVNFDMSPSSTFADRKAGREVSFIEYYKNRYDKRILDTRQPLLLVVQNNQRQAAQEGDGPNNEIFLIPELCNIAGLTDAQRNDNRLRTDLIRSSQIHPSERVNNMLTFLRQLHDHAGVKSSLENWGYVYEKEPVRIKGRILPTQSIGLGRQANLPPDQWRVKVDQSASFDNALLREQLAKAPSLPRLAIIISRTDSNNERAILGKLKEAFDKIGLNAGNVSCVRIVEGDSAHHYVSYIKKLPPDSTAALIILPMQNKERYDAVKKIASVERGLITQVVTSKLMMDDRKSRGAATKIGIQLAAKLGGEPWYVHLPLASSMICGYDTNHDTTNRGRSYGAFLASMNGKFSRWFSKADSHDRLDELSSHMAENLSIALNRYKELNNKYPERVFIYRDGVSDGQLEHVYNVELRQILTAIRNCDRSIRLTFTVVNKRIGARFYMRSQNSFENPPPGSVVDDVVTRQERYDFYLVSQSTRHGTVTPTYYNIIWDQSTLDLARHQAMAFKLCFLYYNWSGTVRVPAPCQYAHKLALLCGEHLHAVPNSCLDDRLHFL